MLSSKLIGLATFTYLFCMVLYFCYLFFRNKRLGSIVTGFVILGLAIHTAGLGFRWYESYQIGYGHAPLSNLYEALVSLAWTTVIIYLIIEYKFKVKTLGALMFPIIGMCMAYAALSPTIREEIDPLMPALQSNWLTFHVLTCFFGYSGFAVSFVSSIAYLLKLRKSGLSDETDLKNETLLPSLKALDEITYKTVAIGFLLFSVGIITGAVWANYAWGSYWSWDPKETWSLITWFVYAAFLHARFTRGWKGRKAAILSICSFISVIFTFLGVNYLISGLHSYA